MREPRPDVTVPFRLSRKNLAVSIFSFILSLMLCWQFYRQSGSWVLPACLLALFCLPLVSALVQQGKPVLFFGPTALESILLPKEMGYRLHYADIASVWLVYQQSTTYLCLALHHPNRVLASLPKPAQDLFKHLEAQGRGHLFLTIGTLAVDPEFLRDELRSRLNHPDPAVHPF